MGSNNTGVFVSQKKSRKWLWVIGIIILVFIIIPIAIIALIFITSPKGEVVLEGSGFVFSKNSDSIVFFKGGDIKITDLKFEDINIIPECKNLYIFNTKGIQENFFSPSGNKILCSGEQLDEKYPGAVPNANKAYKGGYRDYYYPYYNLYIYNANTKNTELLTLNKEDLMYSTDNSFPTFYAWIDENTVIYMCRPQGGIHSSLIKGDVYDFSTFCKMDLTTKEVKSTKGLTEEFYEGKTNAFEGRDGRIEIHTTPSNSYLVGGRNSCLPNFDNTLCVYSKINFLGESMLSYKLYVKGDRGDKYVYKRKYKSPEAVYWSKDDNLFVRTGKELRLVY